MRGIDYGTGLSNIDPETGIRYGWISWHDLDPEVTGEISALASDAATSRDIDERTDAAFLAAFPEEGPKVPRDSDTWAGLREAVAERIYCGCADVDGVGETVTYEGVTVYVSSDGILVSRSPVIAWDGALCSPCAPGAADLRTCDVRGASGLPGVDDVPADVAYDVPADWLYRGEG